MPRGRQVHDDSLAGLGVGRGGQNGRVERGLHGGHGEAAGTGVGITRDEGKGVVHDSVAVHDFRIVQDDVGGNAWRLRYLVLIFR